MLKVRKLQTVMRLGRGFEYYQVKRDEHFAIYEQRSGDKLMHYEVWKIRLSDPCTAQAHLYSKIELAPREANFNECGWSYKTLKKAEQKFNSLRKENEI